MAKLAAVDVAFEVARALHAPLDVIVVRKLGVPFQPELAMGAIGEGGVRIINNGVAHMAGVNPRSWRRSRHANGPSSNVGPAAFAATGPGCRWRDGPR